MFKKNKVTWLKGFGSLEATGQVKVTSDDGSSEIYTCDHTVIATGSAPIEILLLNLIQNICDSTDALAWDKAPKDLVVVGGGVIGLELGSVWNHLGSNVIVIEALDKILGPTDKSISNQLLKSLKKKG